MKPPAPLAKLTQQLGLPLSLLEPGLVRASGVFSGLPLDVSDGDVYIFWELTVCLVGSTRVKGPQS